MTYVTCEVSDGLRAAEATVGVRNYNGRMEYLPIHRGMLARSNGKDLLPVHLIHWDEARGAALVGLPDEADSGASRLWVHLADLESLELAS